MPDYDNIPRGLPKGWRGCAKAAVQGAPFLAQKLHHLTAREINRNPQVKEAVGLLEELLPQLQRIAAAPVGERLTAELELPRGAESTRLKAAAVQCAERLAVGMALGDPSTADPDGLREQLYRDFCLAIPRINAFGPLLTVGVPFPYEDVDRAQSALEACEALLEESLGVTAAQLAADPEACKVKPVKAPVLPKPTQEELVQTEVGLDLDALKVGE